MTENQYTVKLVKFAIMSKDFTVFADSPYDAALEFRDREDPRWYEDGWILATRDQENPHEDTLGMQMVFDVIDQHNLSTVDPMCVRSHVTDIDEVLESLDTINNYLISGKTSSALYTLHALRDELREQACDPLFQTEEEDDGQVA